LRLRADGAMQRRARSLEQRLAALSNRLGKQDPAQRLALAQRRFHTASQALGRLRNSLLSTRSTQLNQTVTRLNALSPLAVLSRGYALVYDEQGSLLRSVDSIQPGQLVRARLGSGSLTATVKDIST
jgi:exodeoxyribonuclease VII large subunit